MLRSFACLLFIYVALPVRAADTPPLVVAHRGASGYLPEHTLEAYALAHAQGADYIEPDVVLSKDGVLICCHDHQLDSTTDVAAKFPDRRRDDGHWYVIDFTLGELKTLSVHGRNDPEQPGYQLATLEEMLTLVQRLNERTGRNAGTIPELKAAGWHAKQGAPLEEKVLEMYARFGQTKRADKVIVQCFEPDSLRRMRNELKSDLTQLLLLRGPLPEAKLAEAASFVDYIGPALPAIGPGADKRAASSPLVEAAHRQKLKVIPFTFGNDEDGMRLFLDRYKVDGFFTDFPDVGVRARSATSASAAGVGQ